LKDERSDHDGDEDDDGDGDDDGDEDEKRHRPGHHRGHKHHEHEDDNEDEDEDDHSESGHEKLHHSQKHKKESSSFGSKKKESPSQDTTKSGCPKDGNGITCAGEGVCKRTKCMCFPGRHGEYCQSETKLKTEEIVRKREEEMEMKRCTAQGKVGCEACVSSGCVFNQGSQPACEPLGKCDADVLGACITKQDKCPASAEEQGFPGNALEMLATARVILTGPDVYFGTDFPMYQIFLAVLVAFLSLCWCLYCYLCSGKKQDDPNGGYKPVTGKEDLFSKQPKFSIDEEPEPDDGMIEIELGDFGGSDHGDEQEDGGNAGWDAFGNGNGAATKGSPASWDAFGMQKEESFSPPKLTPPPGGKSAKAPAQKKVHQRPVDPLSPPTPTAPTLPLPSQGKSLPEGDAGWAAFGEGDAPKKKTVVKAEPEAWGAFGDNAPAQTAAPAGGDGGWGANWGNENSPKEEAASTGSDDWDLMDGSPDEGVVRKPNPNWQGKAPDSDPVNEVRDSRGSIASEKSVDDILDELENII